MDLDNTDKRITEIVASLQARNMKLGLNSPSYGDVRKICKALLDEYSRAFRLRTDSVLSEKERKEQILYEERLKAEIKKDERSKKKLLQRIKE